MSGEKPMVRGIGLGIILFCLLSSGGAWGRGDELLSQLLNINQEGLQAKGRVTIRSLSPPHAEIHLEDAMGEGPRLVKLISRWMQLPPEIMQDFPIKHMTLREANMVFKAGEWTMTAQRLTIPEGEIFNITYSKTPEGQWQMALGKAVFERMPPWPGLPQLGAVKGDTLSAHGDGRSLRWEIKSWRGGGIHLDNGSGSFNGEATTPLLPWSGRAGKVMVDLAAMWGWAADLPQVARSRQDLSRALGVDNIHPSGRLHLQSPDYQGGFDPSRQVVGDLKGKGGVSLAEEGVTLLAANKVGKEEKIQLRSLNGQLRGDGEGMTLEQARLSLQSGGGTAELTGNFSWRLEKNRYDFQLNSLALAGWSLSGGGGWQQGGEKPLALSLTGPKGQSVVAEGKIGSWTWKKQHGIDLILSSLVVHGLPKGELKEIPLFRQAVPTRIRAKQATFDNKVIHDFLLTSR